MNIINSSKVCARLQYAILKKGVIRSPYRSYKVPRCPIALTLHGRDTPPGIVVTMPGSQACVRRFVSPLNLRAGWPGRFINVRRFGGLCMGLLQLKDPLELFVKRRVFLSGFVSLSRRDMT